MKTAKEIFDLGMRAWEKLNPSVIFPALRAANEGAIEDFLNINGSRYYQWSASLIRELKPSQIVELGGAMGVWTICALYFLPSSSKLYSITLEEGGLEFSYIVDDYPNLIKVIGDDLNLENWPKDMDWSKTDLLFIDTKHEEDHLRKELALYLPLLQKGTLVLLDDIRINDGMFKVWQELPYDKLEITNPCHYSGFGCFVL